MMHNKVLSDFLVSVCITWNILLAFILFIFWNLIFSEKITLG